MNTSSSAIAIMSDPPPPTTYHDRRRERLSFTSRRRLLRFAAFEAIPIAAFLSSISAAVYLRPANGVFTALTIAAAIAVGVVPVVLYGPERSR
jgi:hypothetical protein